MKIEPAQRFEPASGVHARRFDRSVVILDLSGGQYFGLDEAGALAWEKLSTGYSPDEIVDLLRAEYSVTEVKARSDVLRLAEDLVRANLLVSKTGEGH
jgi:hypothetical protein